jgi:hypothetical protein
VLKSLNQWFSKKQFFATLAQSVEQETENPRVAGSNPAGGNFVFIFVFWAF